MEWRNRQLEWCTPNQQELLSRIQSETSCGFCGRASRWRAMTFHRHKRTNYWQWRHWQRASWWQTRYHLTNKTPVHINTMALWKTSEFHSLTIKAHPAEPQKSRAEINVGDMGWLQLFEVDSFSGANGNGITWRKGRVLWTDLIGLWKVKPVEKLFLRDCWESRGDVDWSATSKVKGVVLSQPAVDSPGPVGDEIIDKCAPENEEDTETCKLKASTFWAECSNTIHLEENRVTYCSSLSSTSECQEWSDDCKHAWMRVQVQDYIIIRILV